MTENLEDAYAARLARGATGLLREFNIAGVLDAADVHVASRLTTLAGEADERVALALALAVRAVRLGSICVDLLAIRDEVSVEGGNDPPWPDPESWLAAVAGSPVLGEPPVLRLEEGRLLYLDRYWREEEQVCRDLVGRSEPVAAEPSAAVLADLFPAGPAQQAQSDAARRTLQHATSVLTGGPGTGKTTTVARILALLADDARRSGRPPLQIALAAPTGKAAARLQQAVSHEVDRLGARAEGLWQLRATTLHRLLGSLPRSSSRFRHHRDNRLPHDVVVVDETSMVSLTMMARLLEALRPECRLLLVGDPHQLASVEAGAVLADLVDGLARREAGAITRLEHSFRFGASIGALAQAIRVDDPDAVIRLLRAGGPEVEFVETDAAAADLRPTLLGAALALREHAEAGNVAGAIAALDHHRLLCAHREGPFGVQHWNRQVERWLSDETGEGIWSAWYAGRPLLVSANDYGLGLYNGDVGVAVRVDGVLRACVAATDGTTTLATSRLGSLETMHAMTVHKSQGSQAGEVTVLLPPEDSPLLTRELFYTAVTRAQQKVRVVGTEAAVRRAVERRAQRASGLAARLAAAPTS